MKSDRLLAEMLLLQSRGRLRAAELAARLEVSVRTVYRDIASLSAAGVPVYAERGRHGGIALVEGYRTDVTGLTANESRALFVLAAGGTHRALGLDSELGSALRKVLAALPAPFRPEAETISRRILVDPDRWLAGPRPEIDLDTLKTAVLDDHRLQLHYRHSGTTTPRRYTVDPYGLVCKAGVWYLVADHRRAPHLYRADRIAGATALEAPVQRRADVELDVVWRELQDAVEKRPRPVTVHARVRTDRLDFFLRLVGHTVAAVARPVPAAAPGTPGEGESESGETGWTSVTLSLPVVEAVNTLAQFGDAVEVDAPAAARRILARTGAALLAQYGEATGREA